MIIITDSVSFREVLSAVDNTGKRLMVKNSVTDQSYWVTPKSGSCFEAVNITTSEHLDGECYDGGIRLYETVDIKGPCYPVGNFTVHIYPAVDKEVLDA